VVSRLGDDVGGSSRRGNAPGGDQLLSDTLDDGDSTVEKTTKCLGGCSLR